MILDVLILGALNRGNRDRLDIEYGNDNYEKSRDERIFSYSALMFVAWPLVMTFGLFRDGYKFYISLIPLAAGAALVFTGSLVLYFWVSAACALLTFIVMGLTED